MTIGLPHPSWLPDLSGVEGPLYRGIVTAIEADIDGGRLSGGERLPTQRELANALGLGLGTITAAYQEAERRGLIRGVVGRGTFVAGEAEAAAEELGTPDERTHLIEMSVDLPVHAEDPDLATALAALSRRSDLAPLLRYPNPAGLPRHRRAGTVWLRHFELSAEPDGVLVCAGTQHALTTSLMAIAEPGERVLCGSLSYPGMKAVARQLRLRLEAVPMDAHGLLPDEVEAICRQRKVRALYCVPSFHNPTTAQLDAERRKRLAELAEQFDFYLLEDDVHRLASDSPSPPIASRIPERSFYIASLSKAVSGGLRIAFLRPPKRRLDAVAQAIWATVWMVPPLMAELASTWIEDGTAMQVAAKKRAEATARQELARELLGDYRYHAQPCGYYLWLPLPSAWSSAEFAYEARRRGLAITPSNAFVVDDQTPPPAVRVCLAAPDTRERMIAGLEVLRDLLRELPGQSLPIL